MASNNSFTLNGATPNMGYTPPLKAGQSAFSSQGTFATNITPMTNPSSVFGKMSMPSSTPAAAALNKAAPNANFQTLTGQNVAKPVYPANMNYNTQPPTPSTPVKKVTTNNVDGSSNVTEYHAPQTPGIINTNPQESPTPSVSNAGFQGNGTPGTDPYSYAGLIKRVADAGSQGKTQQSQTADEIAGLRKNLATDTGVVLDQPQELNFQTGRINALQTQEAAKESALNEKLQAETAANTQNLNGLTTAAGLMSPSNQFTQVPYSNQIIGADGKPIQGNGTLPAEGQSFVNSLADQVKSGQMTRADAESRLGPYGVAGLQSLNTALGSNFNTNASNASAATTATGQQIQAAITPANQALDALQTAFNGLSGLQQGNVPIAGNVPILSQIVQNASMALGPGRDAASAFQGALQEARSRIDAALVGSIGVNAAAQQASALLPDNMAPSELPQKIAAAKQYLQNQLSSYTGSGNQSSSSNTNSNANITWGSLLH